MANSSTIVLSLAAVFFVSSCCGGGAGVEKYKCKSMQAEAMAGLQSGAATMEASKAESGQYPKTIAELEKAGWSHEKKFYSYSIVSSEAAAFTLEATGTGEMAGDVVRIDQDKKINTVTDKCK